MRPFVSVDVCPWDLAELPEWREALHTACQQWREDAADALAQVCGGAEHWPAGCLQARLVTRWSALGAGTGLPVAALLAARRPLHRLGSCVVCFIL